MSLYDRFQEPASHNPRTDPLTAAGCALSVDVVLPLAATGRRMGQAETCEIADLDVTLDLHVWADEPYEYDYALEACRFGDVVITKDTDPDLWKVLRRSAARIDQKILDKVYDAARAW